MKKVPGVRALAFASRWFEPQTVSTVFEPLVADWQREWQEAPVSRRKWVTGRASAAFVCATIVSSPRIVMTAIPRTITVAVISRIAIFSTTVGIVLGLPLARKLEPRLLDATWTETWLLRILPGTLMMAFPFAMVLAVDAIRRRNDVAPRVKRSAVLRLALVSFLFAAAAESFIVPFASEQWLHASTPDGWNVPQPLPQDSSTVALLRNPDRLTANVPGRYTRAGEIRRALIARSVATVLPALLIWLRWTMLERSRRWRYWPLSGGPMTALIFTGFAAAYMGGMYAELQLRWQAGNGLWLPIVVFSVWALLEQRRAIDPQEA